MEDAVYKRHIDNFNKHWWFQGRKKIIENCISSIITNKKNQILDYGAGSGVNVEMLSKFGRLDNAGTHPNAPASMTTFGKPSVFDKRSKISDFS